MKEIYLDNSATTKISEEALGKYIEISRECYGNPSSLHGMGFKAESIMEEARASVRESLSAKGAEVIFCASGSEANNLAILGRAFSKDRFRRGAKVVTTEGEHASVEEPLRKLESQGFRVVRIPTKGGKLDTGALMRELTGDVILATVMMVNNETGALYDLAEVAGIIKRQCPDAYLHVDATQSYLKLPFTLSSLGADMITVSSHKIEGPKGVGALVISERVKKERGLAPLILGGGQESGMRSGTENVPAIAAFGEAVRLGRQNLRERFSKTSELRRYLIEKLSSEPSLSEISLTLPERTAPHILNITLPNIKSETMLHFLSSHGIFVSSGSACSSNSRHVSSALLAYGRSEAEADSSIRISFSARNGKSDVDELCDKLAEGLKKLTRVR